MGRSLDGLLDSARDTLDLCAQARDTGARATIAAQGGRGLLPAPLLEELRKDGRLFIPSEANFVMIETGQDVSPLIEAFRSRGIRVGRRFAALPTFLRISIGLPEEMDAFLAGLRALVPTKAAA